VAAPVGPSIDELRERIKVQYPAYAWLLDDPEIGALLMAAVQGQIDQATFEARLKATTWWTSNSEGARALLILEHTDPASAKLQVNQRVNEFKGIAAKFGLTFVWPEAHWYAVGRESILKGEDESSMVDSLVDRMPDDVIATSVIARDVKAMQQAYLTPMQDPDLIVWARGIMKEDRSAEQLQVHLGNIAKGRYPDDQVHKLIDAGVTPAEIFSPTKALIAEELELGNEVNLMDSKWTPIFTMADPNAGKIRLRTEAEEREWIRNLPEWSDTRGAQAQGAQLVDALLQQFGVKK
jgi:hypothetical protein